MNKELWDIIDKMLSGGWGCNTPMEEEFNFEVKSIERGENGEPILTFDYNLED